MASALQECDRLRDLTEDLLSMARADADQITGRAPTDIGDLVDGVLSRFGAWCHQRRVDLARAGDAVVAAEPRSIDRAAGNLVDNVLATSTRVAPSGWTSSTAGPPWRLRSTATAPGSTNRSQPLARLGRSDTSRNSEGMGLGLAIVSAVAAAHGGSVELDESPLGGLRVVARLDPQGRRVGRVDGESASPMPAPTAVRQRL